MKILKEAVHLSLKENIRQVLQQVKTFEQFEQKMKSLGYQVLKGRGIAFIDDKKVKIKGSEVGYSLMKIERMLSQKQEQRLLPPMEKNASGQMPKEKQPTDSNQSGNAGQKTVEKMPAKEKELPLLDKHTNNMMEVLLKPERTFEPDPFLPKKKKKKKQKPRQNP